RIGPVGLVDGKAAGRTAVFDVGIEGDLAAHGGIIVAHFFEEPVRIDVFEFAREVLERVGADLADALNAIFVTQEMGDLAVEDLPGELTGLFEYGAAVPGVSIVAKVGTLIDEAPPA